MRWTELVGALHSFRRKGCFPFLVDVADVVSDENGDDSHRITCEGRILEK